MAKALRLWVNFAVLFGMLWLFGCGGKDLTGGSIPPGNPGPARIVGVVVDAEEPSVPLADAEVEIVTEDGSRFVTRTDTDGMFVVEVPRSKKCIIRIRPPGGMMGQFQPREDELVADAEEVRLLLPLWRIGVSFPPDAVAELRLHPSQVMMRVGEKVTFEVEVQLLTQPTSPLPLPVWSVHGRVGIILPTNQLTATFIATRTGEGRVKVRLGRNVAEAKVKVVE